MIKPHAGIAEQFGRALMEGAFNAAHKLLTGDQKRQFSPDDLRESLESMIAHGDGPITHIEVMDTLEEWPDKQAKDVGWAYVAICGDDFLQGVAVVVTKEHMKLLIRSIKWGRP